MNGWISPGCQSGMTHNSFSVGMTMMGVNIEQTLIEKPPETALVVTR